MMLQEDLYTEFKQSFNEDTIVTLAAFANAKGGTVYVGVKDDATPCGVSLGTETVQHWINEIKQKTEPSVIPDVEVVEMDGKQVVRLYVQEYPVKPVSARGRYYRRQANSNHQLTAVEIADLSLQTRNVSWDAYPYMGAGWNDLDEEKIRKFIGKANASERFSIPLNPKDALEKLDMFRDDVPTNAAMLLFPKRDLHYNVRIRGLIADYPTMQFFYRNENYGFSAGFSYEVQREANREYEETGQETGETGKETGQEAVKTGQETVKTGQETEETGKETGQEAVKTGQETSSPKILSLIKVLGDETLTLKEIMNGLDMKNRDNFMKNYLSPAIAGGYLAMLYPEVPRHRKQAYYLTEKGFAVCYDKV